MRLNKWRLPGWCNTNCRNPITRKSHKDQPLLTHLRGKASFHNLGKDTRIRAKRVLNTSNLRTYGILSTEPRHFLEPWLALLRLNLKAFRNFTRAMSWTYECESAVFYLVNIATALRIFNIQIPSLLHRVFRSFNNRCICAYWQTSDFVGKDYYRDQEFSLSNMGYY